MMIKLSLLSILLFSLASSTPLPTKEQEEQARGLLEDIIIGQIQNQINNLLGISTTRKCKPHSDPARFDIPQHHHHHHHHHHTSNNNNKVWGSAGWWSSLLGLVIMIIVFIFYLAS